MSNEVTYGQKAVGTSFNVTELTKVDAIKQNFANAIDMINDLRNNSDDPEVKRMCSIAITEAQAACMWAVKAATWQK